MNIDCATENILLLNIRIVSIYVVTHTVSFNILVEWVNHGLKETTPFFHLKFLSYQNDLEWPRMDIKHNIENCEIFLFLTTPPPTQR